MLRGSLRGRDSYGLRDGYAHTAIFKTNNQQGQHMECYVTACMGGEIGGEWIQIYVRLSLFTAHLKPSQYCLLFDYTPIQN